MDPKARFTTEEALRHPWLQVCTGQWLPPETPRQPWTLPARWGRRWKHTFVWLGLFNAIFQGWAVGGWRCMFMSVGVSVGMSCVCVQALQPDLDEQALLWPILVPLFSESAVQLCSVLFLWEVVVALNLHPGCVLGFSHTPCLRQMGSSLVGGEPGYFLSPSDQVWGGPASCSWWADTPLADWHLHLSSLHYLCVPAGGCGSH